MTIDRNWALTEMMNESADPARLQKLSDRVFGNTPLWKAEREARAATVRMAITLLAAGTPPETATAAIVRATKGERSREWASQMMSSILDLADANALRRGAVTGMPADAAIRVAASYASLISGTGSPSEELTDLATEVGDGYPNYDEAGRQAMLGVMRLLTEPGAASINKETLRLWSALNAKMESALMAAAEGLDDESFVEAVEGDDGSITVILEREGDGMRAVILDNDPPGEGPSWS